MERGGIGSAAALLAAVAGVALGGCSVTSGGVDVVNGKQLFIQECASCHTLARANAHGTIGPNLDEAFERSRQDGLGQSTFAGVVERQIEDPNRNGQTDPATGKPLPSMPAGLVTGSDARDVAAYVAQSAGLPGKDTGSLANVGQAKAHGTAKETNGTLQIPVAPTGLAYTVANAAANAGQVTIESKNPQPIQHDIAIQGNGVTVRGQLVSGGGVSKVTANLKPGTYTFFCTVPGHREGGMVGKLVVK